MTIHGHTWPYTAIIGHTHFNAIILFQEHFCSIANILCSFQNDSPPPPTTTATTTTTKLLLGPLSFARGQKDTVGRLEKQILSSTQNF